MCSAFQSVKILQCGDYDFLLLLVLLGYCLFLLYDVSPEMEDLISIQSCYNVWILPSFLFDNCATDFYFSCTFVQVQNGLELLNGDDSTTVHNAPYYLSNH